MRKGCFYMLVSPIMRAVGLVAAMMGATILEAVLGSFGVKSASPPPGFGNPA